MSLKFVEDKLANPPVQVVSEKLLQDIFAQPKLQQGELKQRRRTSRRVAKDKNEQVRGTSASQLPVILPQIHHIYGPLPIVLVLY